MFSNTMDIVVFAKALYKDLRERREDLSAMLTAGSIQNWEQYKQVVGEIRGLETAIESIKALLERTEDDVEDTLSS